LQTYLKKNLNNDLFNINKKIIFCLSFVSLITPNFIKNFSFLINQFKEKKKVFLKQSYILLTWFYYLNIIEQNKTKDKNLSFFINPIKKKISTQIKAPIAHKN
jgi:hypothetical protein